MVKYLRTVMVLMCCMSIGCGTMMHGSTKKIKVTSEPSGAQVFFNGERVGETPTKVVVKRLGGQKIVVAKDGYTPVSTKLKTKPDFWNLVGFGVLLPLWGLGFVSYLVDGVTDSKLDIKPGKIDLELEANQLAQE